MSVSPSTDAVHDPHPWAHDLDTLNDHAWQRLIRGVRDRHAPARHPTLATVSPDGFPQARTVVLRAADRSLQRLEIHTNLFSAKVEELRQTPVAALHIWDSGSSLQIHMMLDKFNTEIAQCLGSMSHAQLEDICWEGAQYLLVGDWRSPSVSLVVGQYTKLDHIAEPILVALRMEPLLFPCEPEGERLDNIEIRNALEMLLKEAEEVGVASLLMDGLKKCIFFQGLDRAECADLSASSESKDPA